MLRAPKYLDDALRGIDPELSLKFDPRSALFFIARKPFGTRLTQVTKWICKPCNRPPCRGFLWPDWFNTVEWVLQADWSRGNNRLALDALLSGVDQETAALQGRKDAAVSDRIHGELKPMTDYAVRKKILERRIGRG